MIITLHFFDRKRVSILYLRSGEASFYIKNKIILSQKRIKSIYFFYSLYELNISLFL